MVQYVKVYSNQLYEKAGQLKNEVDWLKL